MKKYTVFLDTPDADIDDPPYWVQVKAEDARAAVKEAREIVACDFSDAYGEGFVADDETFPLRLLVNGWPKFSFELEEER